MFSIFSNCKNKKLIINKQLINSDTLHVYKYTIL